MADEKGIDRIRKLLNMTVENGCSEDEQETALRMAANAAAKLGIELDSILAKDTTAAKRKAIYKAHRQAFKIHQGLAAEAAAALVGIEVNVYNYGENGIAFVGREELIELAEEIMFWLFRQIEELYKQALPKGLSKSARGEFRKTFKAACAMRTRDRAYSHMASLKRNDVVAQEATGQNALVVAGYFETLAEETRDYWEETLYAPMRIRREKAEAAEQQRLALLPEPERVKELERKAKEQAAAAKREARLKGPRGRSMPYGNGSTAGFAAGDRVKLRKEIG